MNTSKINSPVTCINDVDTWLEFCAKKGRSAQNHDLLSEKLSLWNGDITNLSIDCIVNAANARLDVGGGVDGAIHRKAGGRTLYRKTKALYQNCLPGNAVIVNTQGTNLECKFVIHAVGPTDKDDDKEALLRASYLNSLQHILTQSDIRTVAFPCISTGVYGYDSEEAAHVALSAVSDWLNLNDTQVDRIIFCTYLPSDFDIYERLMNAYILT